MTLRKLTWMAKARQLDQWLHTANILSLMSNVNRDPNKRRQPFDLFDFIPDYLAKRPKKRQKSASELFARLSGIEGIGVETVTESTSWQQAAQTA